MSRFAPFAVVPLLLCACSSSSLPQARPVGTASSLASKTAVPAPTSTVSEGPELSCGPRPAPASSALLETTLTFPPVVTPTTPGRFTVRNTGSKPVMMENSREVMVLTVQGNNLTSDGPVTTVFYPYTPLAPGQTREFPVAMAAYGCSSGSIDTNKRVPYGRHQVIAQFHIDKRTALASVAVEVNVQAAP